MQALAAAIEIRWMLLALVVETMVAAVAVPFVEAVIKQHATAEGRVARSRACLRPSESYWDHSLP